MYANSRSTAIQRPASNINTCNVLYIYICMLPIGSLLIAISCLLISY